MATTAPPSVSSSVSLKPKGKAFTELRWYWTPEAALRFEVSCIALEETLDVPESIKTLRLSVLEILSQWVVPERWLLAAWELHLRKASLTPTEAEALERKLRKRLLKKIPKAAKKGLSQLEKRNAALVQ